MQQTSFFARILKRSFWIATLVLWGIVIFFLSVMAYFWWIGRVNGLIMVDLGKNSAIEKVQHGIKPLIDEIIRHELGAIPSDTFPKFVIKPRHNLTLYYLDGHRLKDSEFLISTLEAMQKSGHGNRRPEGVQLIAEAALFGDHKDEIVLKIADTKNQLQALHTDIRTAFLQAQQEYSQTHHRNLYDVARSERFPYVPHIALGRISLEPLRKYFRRHNYPHPDNAAVEAMLQRIRSRIEREALPAIAKILAGENLQLPLHHFTLKTRNESKIFELD